MREHAERAGDESGTTAPRSAFKEGAGQRQTLSADFRSLRGEHPLLQLQRRYGNRYVQRVVALAAQRDQGASVPSVESAIEQARGGGRPLDGQVQQQMETAFGVSFSGVKVHTGAEADILSRSLNATAFTTGNDIFFRHGEYNPGSSSGRELLAHELTHVVQQGQEGPRTKLALSEPGDRSEQEADMVAHAVMQRERQVGFGKAPRQARLEGQLRRDTERVQAEDNGAGAVIGGIIGGIVGAGAGFLAGGPVGAVVGGVAGAGIGAAVGGLATGPASPGTPATPAPRPPAVTLPGKIRAASTPAAMAADRIPPRVDTPVAVTVAGLDQAAPGVTLSVEGASASNGTATIDGAATKDLRSGATVQLRGGTQTAPGNAGNLRVVARQSGAELARSGSFSVSAIPQNWSVSFQSFITEGTDPGMRGIRVTNSWESDSGSVADLDQAKRSENVEVKSASGCFSMAPSHTSGYVNATGGSITDSHGSPASIMTGPGTRVAQQTFKFKDDRTASVDIPATNSGFQISREVKAAGAGFVYHTTKIGAGGTANGVTSTAGAGNVDPGTQPV
jgi:hypothetical protein